MTGLVIGKFYPPHGGHKHLISTARSQVDRLFVVLCAKPNQLLSGDRRASWLRETHPDCEVLLVDDTLPDDSQLWADFCLQVLPVRPDVVFSSEAYGEPFAKCLESRHVLVDLERESFPVSGTSVRHDPLANWSFLEPCVREHLAMRIVLIGAESTGKTTLAERLATHLDTNWVAEYGREYCENKFSGLDPVLGDPDSLPPWTSDEFVRIAETQTTLEARAARSSNGVLLCDTNAVATTVWHKRYVGTDSEPLRTIKESTIADLYLVTAPDVPFVQDGTRDGENLRTQMHLDFLRAVEESKVPYVVLTGTYEDRFRRAVEATRESAARPERYNWEARGK